MKNLPIFLLIFLSIKVFSQNPVHLDKIATQLKLEKFNGEHTFIVDTTFKINDYTIYSITPFVSSLNPGWC